MMDIKNRHVCYPSGPIDASIMIIGEAPGFNEERQGAPYVGVSGDFLNDMLEEVGIHREEVFVTNACKCRPRQNAKKEAGNKAPLKAYVKQCNKYLTEEILYVKPSVIIATGALAISAVIGKHKTKSMKSTNSRIIVADIREDNPHIVYQDPEIMFFGTYHPSHILRAKGDDRERLEKRFKYDLKKALKHARKVGNRDKDNLVNFLAL